MVQERLDNGVVITLRGTENQTQIAIPQLQKQFAQFGLTDEVQFIVKDFAFHTEFINLKRGDGFNFWLPFIETQTNNSLSHSPTLHEYGRNQTPFSVPLVYDTDIDEFHVTTDEFVLILNRSKLYALKLYSEQHTDQSVTTMTMQKHMFNVLLHVEFVYDYTTGKIGMKIEPSAQPHFYYYDHTINHTLDTIRDLSVLMQPFSELTDLNQYRLAQLMGLNTNIDRTIGSLADAQYEYTFTSPHLEMYIFRPTTVNTQIFPATLAQSMTIFAPNISDNLPNKFVIIKSTARSNVVSGEGKREGILLSIPITHSSIETYQTYKDDQLAFASKDTLQGVKSMHLEFVDEFNQPLTFRTPYEIKIGVYFK